MTGATPQTGKDAFMTPLTTDDAAADQANMAKYGIRRVPSDYYQFKDYRYTRLEDAIAQAQRHEQTARQR